MTQTDTNKPAYTERFGGLKGTIWKNDGKDGKPDRFSVTYSRSYRTADGKWNETSSLGEIDNLKLGHLVSKVTDRIMELKAIYNGGDDTADGGEE